MPFPCSQAELEKEHERIVRAGAAVAISMCGNTSKMLMVELIVCAGIRLRLVLPRCRLFDVEKPVGNAISSPPPLPTLAMPCHLMEASANSPNVASARAVGARFLRSITNHDRRRHAAGQWHVSRCLLCL